MLKTSETTAKLVEALHKVQGDVRGVGKSAQNSHFKSSYANLEAVILAIQDACQEHGVVFQQFVGPLGDNSTTVITRISHISGEWQECTAELPIVKRDPQQAGSAITYARRYSLLAAFGLPALDDDAEEAMGRGKAAGKVEPVAAKPDEPKRMSAAEAKRSHFPDFERNVKQCQTREDIRAVWSVLNEGKKLFPNDYWESCMEILNDRATELGIERKAA